MKQRQTKIKRFLSIICPISKAKDCFIPQHKTNIYPRGFGVMDPSRVCSLMARRENEICAVEKIRRMERLNTDKEPGRPKRQAESIVGSDGENDGG